MQEKGKDKKGATKDLRQVPPLVPEFTQLAPQQREAPVGFNPNMIGDFSGVTGLRQIFVPATATFFVPAPTRPGPPPPPPNFNNGPPQAPGANVPGGTLVSTTINVPVTVRYPIAGRGAIKLGENESPRPQDRVFFSYNYFSNTQAPANGSEFGRTESILLNVDGQPTPATLVVPGLLTPRLDLHRETIGFETTFLDGYGSFGLRVPLFQQSGAAPFGDQDFGDLSMILKVAPWMNQETGNLVSTGLMVTVPTGPDIPTIAGNVHSTLLQPFVGYYFQSNGFFVQGFTSLVVPTDDRDVTLLFNDFGVGYWLYQDPSRFISSLAPTLEVHVATPLNHRSVLDPISASDGVALTSGLHFGLGQRSTLTLGATVPLTGPRPFDVEGVVQFNFRF